MWKSVRTIGACALLVLVVLVFLRTAMPPLANSNELLSASRGVDSQRDEYCRRQPSAILCVSPDYAGVRPTESEIKEDRRAAWREFWIAAGTLALVIGTSALAVFTLELWLETKESARRTLAAASSAHQRELRAYMSVNDMANQTIENPAAPMGNARYAFVFRPVIRNAGRTPALDCTMAIATAVTGPEPDAVPVFDLRMPKNDNGLSAGPDALFQGPPYVSDAKGLMPYYTGEARFFILARVEYRDVFENSPKRHTQAAFEIDVVGDPIANCGMSPYPEGVIRWKAVAGFNTLS